MPTYTGADGYDAVLGRAKPAKGERAAILSYLETDERVLLRQPAQVVGEAGGRVLQQDGVVVLVTDRKIIAARTTGGFRPKWEIFTLPFGHLEPGVAPETEGGTAVSVPTSGRRSYRVQLGDAAAAEVFARSLAEALRAYRRDRMGLTD